MISACDREDHLTDLIDAPLRHSHSAQLGENSPTASFVTDIRHTLGTICELLLYMVQPNICLSLIESFEEAVWIACTLSWFLIGEIIQPGNL